LERQAESTILGRRDAMPQHADRREVQRLLEEGAQLIEVLAEREFDEEHLPGAINIPLKKLDGNSTAALKRDIPVIVYCWDYQ
jgi:rhodanese-related sulfurtransferase